MPRIGTAYVEIKGDFSPLRRELQTFREGRDVDVDVAANVDRTSFSRVKRQKDLLGRDEKFEVKPDIDTAPIRRAAQATKGFDFSMGEANKSAAFLRNSIAAIKWPAMIVGAGFAAQALSAAAGGAAALAGALAPSIGLVTQYATVLGVLGQSVAAFKLATFGVSDALSAYTAQQESAGAAATQSATQIRSAHQQVEAAEESLAAAQRSVTLAQEDLTRAREDAVRQLEDMEEAARDTELTEARARISLRQARRALAEALRDPTTSRLELADLRLSVKEARDALSDAQREGQRVREDARRARQEGVAGSSQVVAARRQLAEANRGVADAEENLAEAQRGVTEAMQSSSSATDAFAEKMNLLSPAAQSFVRALIGMKPRLDALRSAAASNLFPGVQQGMESAMQNFGPFRRVITGTARVLGDLAARAGAFFGSDAFGRDFEKIGQTNNRVLARMGRTALNLAAALTDILVAARPLTNWISKSTEAWSENVRASTRAGRKSGELADFFRETRQVVSRLVSIFSHFGEALWNIIRLGKPLGDEILKRLDESAQHFLKWTESAKGRNEIKEYFEEIGPVLFQAGKLLGDVVKAFFEIGRGPGLSELIKSIRVDLLPVLVKVIEHTTAAFGPELVRLLVAVTELFGHLAGASGPLTIYAKALTAIINGFNKLTEVVPGLETVVVTLLGFHAVMKATAFGSWLTGVTHMVEVVKKLRTALFGLTAAQTAADVGGLTGRLGAKGGLVNIARGRLTGRTAMTTVGGPVGMLTAAEAAALGAGGGPVKGGRTTVTGRAGGALRRGLGRLPFGRLGGAGLLAGGGLLAASQMGALPGGEVGAAAGAIGGGALAGAAFGPWGAAAGAAIGAIIHFRDEIKTIFTEIFNWVKDHWKLLVVVLSGPFAPLAALIVTNIDTIKSAFTGLFDVVSTVVRSVIGAVKKIVSAVDGPAKAIGLLLATPFQIWWGVTKLVFKGIRAGLKQVIEFIKGIFGGGEGAGGAIGRILGAPFRFWFGVVKKVFGFALDKAKDVIEWIKDHWREIANILAFPWRKLGAAVKTAFNFVRDRVGDVVGWLKERWDGVKDVLLAPFKAVVNIIKGLFEKVKGAIEPIVNFVIDRINNLIDAHNALPFVSDIDKIERLGEEPSNKKFRRTAAERARRVGGQHGGFVTPFGIVPFLQGYQRGGLVGDNRRAQGIGPRDRVPALLGVGELVIPAQMVKDATRSSKKVAVALRDEFGKGYKEVGKKSKAFVGDHKDEMDRLRRDAAERTGRFRKDTTDDFQKTQRDSLNKIQRMREGVTDGFGRMRERATSATQGMRENVSDDYRKMSGAVRDGLSKIAQMTNRALDALGVKKVNFRISTDGGGGGGQRRQQGGLIRAQQGAAFQIPGTATGDKVPISIGGIPVAMTEGQEKLFVLNRTASKTLDWLKRFNSKVPRFQLGGMQPAASRMARRFVDMFGGSIVSGFRGGDPGHHGTGDAFDWAGGDWRGASRYANRIGRSLLEGIYRGDQGGVPVSWQSGQQVPSSFWGGATWADHWDHIHIAITEAVRGVARRIKRVMMRGPEGPLTDLGQAALDKVRDAANRFIDRRSGMRPEDIEVGAGALSKGEMRRLLRAHILPDIMGWVAMAESMLNPKAYNTSGASGLWQIMMPLHAGLVGGRDVFDPNVNADVAARLFRSSGLVPWEESRTKGAIPGGWGPHVGDRFQRGGWVRVPRGHFIDEIADLAHDMKLKRGVMEQVRDLLTDQKRMRFGGSFGGGGIVPGFPGQPVPIMAHGGELVARLQRGGDFEGPSDFRRLIRSVARLNREIRLLGEEDTKEGRRIANLLERLRRIDDLPKRFARELEKGPLRRLIREIRLRIARRTQPGEIIGLGPDPLGEALPQATGLGRLRRHIEVLGDVLQRAQRNLQTQLSQDQRRELRKLKKIDPEDRTERQQRRLRRLQELGRTHPELTKKEKIERVRLERQNNLTKKEAERLDALNDQHRLHRREARREQRLSGRIENLEGQIAAERVLTEQITELNRNVGEHNKLFRTVRKSEVGILADLLDFYNTGVGARYQQVRRTASAGSVARY